MLVRYSSQVLTQVEFFSTDCRKTLQYQTSRKSMQWETNCPMRTDGQTQTDRQTDMTKLIVALCNYVNAVKFPKQSFHSVISHDSTPSCATVKLLHLRDSDTGRP